MTRRNFDFAQEDLLIARRSAWLAMGNEPAAAADLPSKGDVYGALHSALSKSTPPYSHELGLFGMMRWQDAQRATAEDARQALTTVYVPDVKRGKRKRHIKRRRRLELQVVALERETESIEPLRLAYKSLCQSLGPLRIASFSRYHERRIRYRMMGIHTPDPYAQVMLAASLVQNAFRRICGTCANNFRGLSEAERNRFLDVELLKLRDSDMPVAELVFLIDGDLFVQQNRCEAMEQRLRRARRDANDLADLMPDIVTDQYPADLWKSLMPIGPRPTRGRPSGATNKVPPK
jgi:hypothetical protein